MNRNLNVGLIIIWIFLMLFAILAPADSLPNDIGFLSFIPFFDKFVHAGMFGGFAFLLFLLLKNQNKIQRALLTTFLVSISYGFLTEVLQLFLTEIIKRKFEWMDFLADVIGVLIVLGFGYFIVCFKSKNHKIRE